MPSEGEIVKAIEFSNLVLVHFHTPHFNFGQREPKLLAVQIAWLSYSQSNLSVFTQRTFERVDATDLGYKGAYGIRGVPEKNI